LSAFEYVFTFYSLVLGLAAANVVTGFADMWRERSRIAVGLCVPLVALSLLIGIMNAWVTYWQNGASVEMGPSRMIGSALIALPYVFASKVMFPAPGEAASLEDHYFAHRRVLLLALAAPPLVGRVFAWMATGQFVQPGPEVLYFNARIAIPLLLLLAPGKLINRLGLGVLLVVLITGLFR
jgi:hypothetical protein